MNKIIGCISLVPVEVGAPQEKFLAIKCAKGRGIILPGGKMEDGETFRECAGRELKEETGVIAKRQRLMFQCHSGISHYYVYCFLTEADIGNIVGNETREGKVMLATWEDLLSSKFRGYYELMQDQYKRLCKEVSHNGLRSYKSLF